jgi:alginate O-acetyltransferase complex protein AlgJ
MRRVAQLALAATFVIVLFGATAVSYARMAADRFPSLTWRVSTWRWYPPRFEAALSDHLAGRNALLGWHARFKLHTLRTSPSPRVWLGSDGWLFYNHWADLGGGNLSSQYFDRAVERWDEVMRARRDWCEARGIQLRIVIVPDKQTVYPERLPAVVRDRHDGRLLDRTLERLRADPAVPVIDLRPELAAAKEYGSVYYRNDTHWTPLGSYVGAARVVGGLAGVLPGAAPASWLTVPHVLQRRNLGDLWRKAGMQPPPPEEPVLVPDRPDVRAHRTGEKVPVDDSLRLKYLDPVVWEGGTGPRAVLFHDSFADWEFQSVLADRCERLVSVASWQFIDEVVRRERPKVVVCELVERALLNISPSLK